MNKHIATIRKFFPDDNIIFLDTEFNEPNEAHMGTVCFCCEEWKPGAEEPNDVEFWMDDPGEAVRATAWFLSRKKSLLVGHSIVAEFECLVALGLTPSKEFLGACTYLEAVQLQNSWDEFTYGKYIGPLGDVLTSIAPKRLVSKHMSKDEQQEAEDDNENERLECGADSTSEWNPNLTNCLLNFTTMKPSEILLHQAEKDETRRLILSKKKFDQKERRKIIDYCWMDVRPLKALLAGELERLERVLGPSHRPNIPYYVTNRGCRAAHTAVMQRRGIPINKERYENLCKNSAVVGQRIRLDWNAEEFQLYRDETKKGMSLFAPRKLVFDQKSFDAWVETMPDLVKQWPKSTRGYSSNAKELAKLSLSEDDPVGRYLRHAKEKKVLEFYKPENLNPQFLHAERLANLDRTISKNYVGFYVGSDYRMRPHLNPYGTQTGRNGHKAVGFIPAQGKVLRGLIDPPKGYAIGEPDYSSEEDFIPASPRLAGDEEILKAYQAGDPYLSFAALTGKCAFPEVAWWVEHREDQSGLSSENKLRHKELSKYRKAAKPQKLGVGFGMKPRSLARHMNATESDAQAVYNSYWKRVRKYKDFRDRVELKYKELKCPLVLPNGFALGPDNKNMLSVLNFPVQGYGVVILEKFLDIAMNNSELNSLGCEILYTVHDAVGFMAPIGNFDRCEEIIVRFMIQAATEVLRLEGMRVGTERVDHGQYWIHDVDPAKFTRWQPYFESSPSGDDWMWQ